MIGQLKHRVSPDWIRLRNRLSDQASYAFPALVRGEVDQHAVQTGAHGRSSVSRRQPLEITKRLSLGGDSAAHGRSSPQQ